MSTPKRGKSKSGNTPDKSPKNFRWLQAYGDTLLDLLVREARKGNRPDNSFTSTAFRNIVTDFNRIHETSIMKKHVLSRIKTMKQHFHQFHGAFSGLSGFAWNHETKKFEAEDDVWEHRILENPRLTKFRDKICFNWDLLLELYGDTRAKGSQAIGLRDTSISIQRGLHFAELYIDSHDTYIGSTTPNESIYLVDHNFCTAAEEPSSTLNVGSTQESGGSNRATRKRKASLISVLENGYKTMADSMSELSKALIGTGEKVAGMKYDPKQNEEIYVAVDALGLEETNKMNCYCYLTANPSKAAQFAGAPSAIWGKLLDSIMKQSGEK